MVCVNKFRKLYKLCQLSRLSNNFKAGYIFLQAVGAVAKNRLKRKKQTTKTRKYVVKPEALKIVKDGEPFFLFI